MSVDYEIRRYAPRVGSGTQDRFGKSTQLGISVPINHNSRPISRFSQDAGAFFNREVQHGGALNPTTIYKTSIFVEFGQAKQELRSLVPNLAKSQQLVEQFFSNVKSTISELIERKRRTILSKLEGMHVPVVEEIDRRCRLIDSLENWANIQDERTDMSTYDRHETISSQIHSFEEMTNTSRKYAEVLKQIEKELFRVKSDSTIKSLRELHQKEYPYVDTLELTQCSQEIGSRVDDLLTHLISETKLFEPSGISGTPQTLSAVVLSKQPQTPALPVAPPSQSLCHMAFDLPYVPCVDGSSQGCNTNRYPVRNVPKPRVLGHMVSMFMSKQQMNPGGHSEGRGEVGRGEAREDAERYTGRLSAVKSYCGQRRWNTGGLVASMEEGGQEREAARGRGNWMGLESGMGGRRADG